MSEYLVSYGRSGDFGRFRAEGSPAYRRGGPVVIRTEQGTEQGVVLLPRRATAVPARTAGQLLRSLHG